MWLVGLVIGACCSSMAVFISNKILERRRLKYCGEGVTIIEKRHRVDGLLVTHNGAEVERLTKSHVRIWNAGRRAIRPTEVITVDPIVIAFESQKILSVQAVHETRGAIGFEFVDLGDGRFELKFGHWERGAGVILELLHTSSSVVPDITGSIDGFQPIKALGRIDVGSFLSRRHRMFRRWAPLAGALFLAGGVWAIDALKLTPDPKSMLGLVLMAPGEALLITAGIGSLVALQIPKSLRRPDPPDKD